MGGKPASEIALFISHSKRDAAALDRFVAAHPHDQLMVALSPEMGETKFVRWTITGADGIPSWTAALDRLRAR